MTSLATFILPRNMPMSAAVLATEMLLNEPVEQKLVNNEQPTSDALYLLTHLMAYSWTTGGIFELHEFFTAFSATKPQVPLAFLAELTATTTNRTNIEPERRATWAEMFNQVHRMLPADQVSAIHSRVEGAMAFSLNMALTLREQPMLRLIFLLTSEDPPTAAANVRRYAAQQAGELNLGPNVELSPLLLTLPDKTPIGIFPTKELAERYLMSQRVNAGLPATNGGGHGGSEVTESIPFDEAKPHIQVYDPMVASAMAEQARPRGIGEGNAQQARLFELLAMSNGKRYLAEVPEGNPLETLYRDFPHFKDVLDFIASNLALAGCGEEGRQARIPALLLRGEPGTGKTYFSQRLAKAFGIAFLERDLSIVSEAHVLAGIGPNWRGAKPGVVFEAVVNGECANPLILLNEVDKVKASGEHNSPMAPLYSLLEPTSAKAFVDEYAPMEVDASRINWVLTANEGYIPPPILSRLEVFDIRPPTLAECRIIAQSVWYSLINTVFPKGNGFEPLLPDEVLDLIAVMSSRDMRKALTAAASYAVLANRRRLVASDVQKAMVRYVGSTKGSFGFLTQG